MKKVLFVAMLSLLSACSSAPRKVLMKNCEESGKSSGLFYCEEIPKNDIGRIK